MKNLVFVTLPKKETLETNWTDPLTSYITSLYGNADNFTQEIATLHRLRQDVRGAALDVIGRDILYRYYGQLELLDLRIPVNEYGCRMNFTWSDAYDHSPTTQSSLAFEKASLLFNLAVTFCHIANDSDDVKITYAAFQSSAGIFAFIVENFLHAPSTDLSQDTVKALSKLMLAQAQETFLHKVMSDGNSKPLTVAKLAKGASNLYKLAAETLSNVQTVHSWGDKSWTQLCQIKTKMFLAIALEYNCKSLESASKYGEALSCLRQAVEIMTDASKLTVPTIYSEMTGHIKSSLESLNHNLKAFEKDNDFIYHSVVPPFSTLSEITGLEAAKPTPINELYTGVGKDVGKIIGKDIFEKIIPLSVHQKSSMYSEEKAKLLRNEGEKVEVADEELSSALEFLDLPSALHMIRNNDTSDSSNITIPSIVEEWSVTISSADISFDNMLQKRKLIYDNVKKAELLLDQEESNWNSMKMKYGTGWNQSTPSSLTSGIKDDIRKVKESLALGADSDKKVQELISPYVNEIDMLKQGPNSDSLKALYKISKGSGIQPSQSLLDIDETDEASLNRMLEETEKHLARLNKISKERKMVFKEFKEKVHGDDISSLLVLNQKVPNVEEKLFKTELEKFQPYQNRIEAAIHQQKLIVNELTSVWKRVLSSDSVKQITSSSEQRRTKSMAATEKLKKAYTNWKDALDGYEKGMSFYDQLVSLADGILNNAKQYTQNRQEESQNLTRSLMIEPQRTSDDDLRRQLDRLSMNQNSWQSNNMGGVSHNSGSISHSSMSHSTGDISHTTGGVSHGTGGFSPNIGGTQPSNVPQLPPKPTTSQTSISSQNSSGQYDPYLQPSAYDPSLYSSQGNQPQGQGGRPFTYSTPQYSYQQRSDQQPPNQPSNPRYY